MAYTAVADEGLIMQDMTPAEKKRHIKKNEEEMKALAFGGLCLGLTTMS